jgi:hypothetical protein
MIRLPDILAAVADACGLALADLSGPSRLQPVAEARHLAMWLARRHADASLGDIGRALRREANTVHRDVRKIGRRLANGEIELTLKRDLAVALAVGEAGTVERRALERHRAVLRDEAEIAAGLGREARAVERAAAWQLEGGHV